MELPIPMTKPLAGGYPVTPALVAKIEGLLRSQRKKPEDLGMQERTFLRWKSTKVVNRYQSGDPYLARPGTLEDIAKKLGVATASLTAAGASHFGYLEAIASKVDGRLMEFMRAAHDLPTESAKIAYSDLLNARLSEVGMDVTGFIACLAQAMNDDAFIGTVPTPDLYVAVGDDFDTITYSTEADTLRIEKPLLLWDCNCKEPRLRPHKSCRIHSRTEGAAIDSAFRGGMVEVTWRGLRILWRNVKELWPPSVDTFRMAIALDRADKLRSARSVLDLGSGTGFLGLFAAAATHPRKRIVVELADWLLTPALYGMTNYVLNRANLPNTTLRINLGMMRSWFGGEPRPMKPEVVLCNPPYLPTIHPFESLGQHSAVISTALLEDLIARPNEYGQRVFVQYSSVADKEVQAAKRKAKVQLERVASDRAVPFRVPTALGQPDYVKKLILRRGLRRRTGLRYHLWHVLRLREILPSK